jgi:hypothetical protein
MVVSGHAAASQATWSSKNRVCAAVDGVVGQRADRRAQRPPQRLTAAARDLPAGLSLV